MRIFSAALAGLCLLAATAFGRTDYIIKKISPAVILTPAITFNYGPQHPPGRAQQWLEIEVSFDSNVEWTDELTFRYYVLLAGKCLTGEVTHVDIQDVGVQIVDKGQVLTAKSFKTQGEAQWWQNLPQVAGRVLNKNDTPFAPLLYDRYEAIKATAPAQ